jgi:tRNA uracil 4-sulfurtransferase
MSSASSETIVLRIAEIFLKGRNRNAFYRAFVRQARRLLADLPQVEVEPGYLRALVRYPAELREPCIDRLRRLFGLASMAVARRCEPTLPAITAAAVEVARELPSGASFKVETRRRDKTFAPMSPDVSRQVGGEVARATGLPVSIQAPSHVLYVEIDRDSASVSGRTIPGPGGLPIGVSGTVMALLSGGIDSPVAAWSAMRRGCVVQAVYFHSFPYTGDKTREKVADVARILARWQGPLALHVVHFTEVQKALREAGPGELAVVLYRRMMMRTASAIARAHGAAALVTGENLGQVASQTLPNLAVIEDATDLPVLRPLITCDKQEIVGQAQAIGTYDTSILPYEDCCSLFVPKHPTTRARLADAVRAEARLDLAALTNQLIDSSERLVIPP